MDHAIASRISFYRSGANLAPNEKYYTIQDARGLTCKDLVEHTRFVRETEAVKIHMHFQSESNSYVEVWSQKNGYSEHFRPKSLFEDCARAFCGDNLSPAQEKLGETAVLVWFPR